MVHVGLDYSVKPVFSGNKAIKMREMIEKRRYGLPGLNSALH
jgi:hypothetical protein